MRGKAREAARLWLWQISEQARWKSFFWEIEPKTGIEDLVGEDSASPNGTEIGDSRDLIISSAFESRGVLGTDVVLPSQLTRWVEFSKSGNEMF